MPLLEQIVVIPMIHKAQHNLFFFFPYFFLLAEKHCSQRPQAGKYGAEQAVRCAAFISARHVSWPVIPPIIVGELL